MRRDARPRFALTLAAAILLAGLATAQLPPAGPPAPAASSEAAEKPRPTRPKLTPTQLLSARFVRVELQDVPFDQAIEWLAESLGTNVVVLWKRIEAAGIERDTPVTVRARNIRVDQALWIILHEAASDAAPLAYRADEDMIIISTAEDLGEEMIVRVYDVQDLLATRLRRPFMHVGSERDLAVGSVPAVAAGAVATTPVIQRYFSGVELEGEDVGGDVGRDDDRTDPDEHLRELVNVITTSVAPESWDVNGGRGSVRGYRGRLVVRNTAFVHQQLAGPLREPSAGTP